MFFCNSGAEANEAAFKFARRWARAQGHEDKFGIVALRGALSRAPARHARGHRPAELSAAVPPAHAAACRSSSATSTSCAPCSIREAVAAVIVEPIQGEGGVRVLDPEFLRALRTLTHDRDVLLIFDEIQCGLGRTGHLFAYEGVGVVPDMVTIAKPMANGLPIGAVLVNEPVAGAIQPGDHGTTFGGGSARGGRGRARGAAARRSGAARARARDRVLAAR